LQDYVFFELGIDSLIAVNASDNPASRRVKEKTGAVLIGEVILAHRNGEQRSERWMVTAEAWRKLRGRP
jgi:RimJ/RimL family protein N-acetyltransferase